MSEGADETTTSSIPLVPAITICAADSSNEIGLTDNSRRGSSDSTRKPVSELIRRRLFALVDWFDELNANLTHFHTKLIMIIPVPKTAAMMRH